MKRFSFYLLLLIIFFADRTYSQNDPQLKVDNSVSHLSGIYSSKTSLTSISKIVDDGFPYDFPGDKKSYKEDLSKRTFKSRTFTDNSGGVVVQNSYNNINYLDKENKFQPIFAKLSSSENGWSAQQQYFPTYLNKDGSTELSSGTNKVKFNYHCKINGHEINTNDYTVGEDGMMINNVIEGVDKKIIFNENRIETDYLINHPIDIKNKDLVISEEIVLPEGYVIKKETNLQGLANRDERRVLDDAFVDEYVVYSSGNKEMARFFTPVFFDANKNAVAGKYNLINQNDKHVLQIIVSSDWLNDTKRVYPITIDPLVMGDTSFYPAKYMNSCQDPGYASDSMLITIPPNITITAFIVTDSYFADETKPGVNKTQGIMYLTSPCGSTPHYTVDPGSPIAVIPGCAYLDHADLKGYLACCFAPSCVTRTFYLAHFLARQAFLGPGCNKTYIYYSPVSPYPFNAYIIGHTVETTQAQWTVFPNTLCSDSCKVFLKLTTNYGVPPYTITHPWAAGPQNYGVWAGCNSIGKDTIALTIPGCPTSCIPTASMDVPPPSIVDVCGIAVAGLTPKTITIKPVPDVAANAITICSGDPIKIPVSSCVAGATFSWTGNNGTHGTGDVKDSVPNLGAAPITVDYAIIPTANGCIGKPTTVKAQINPAPIIDAGIDQTIGGDGASSAQLNANGATDYVWSPSSGLTCVKCPAPIATPDLTTEYYVTGTDALGCFNTDTVVVTVIQGEEELYIPNAFTPNEDNNNDQYLMFGHSIKKIDIKIFDRWGQLIFQTDDITKGWDGKYKGKLVEEGVYTYTVDCQFESNKKVSRKGMVVKIKAK